MATKTGAKAPKTGAKAAAASSSSSSSTSTATKPKRGKTKPKAKPASTAKPASSKASSKPASSKASSKPASTAKPASSKPASTAKPASSPAESSNYPSPSADESYKLTCARFAALRGEAGFTKVELIEARDKVMGTNKGGKLAGSTSRMLTRMVQDGNLSSEDGERYFVTSTPWKEGQATKYTKKPKSRTKSQALSALGVTEEQILGLGVSLIAEAVESDQLIELIGREKVLELGLKKAEEKAKTALEGLF